MPRPLDIVLLVLDTQRADRLSHYGYQRETSPYLDTFAADSTLFNYAIAPAQWTIPSHSSMFTGVYPSRHATVQSDSVLPRSLPTLAERLRQSGYFTTGFCNNPLVGIINNGLRRGFYSFLNYGGLMTSRPNQAGAPSSLIDKYRQWFKRRLAMVLSGIQDSFARSDALLAFSFTPLMVPLWQTALRFKGNTAKSLSDAAQFLIERRGLRRDQPIFSFINLMGTHMPYHPPRRFAERFAPHVLRDKVAQRYLRRFNSDVYGWLTPLNSDINDHQKATLDSVYDAEVAHQDEQVGDFFAKLRASGALDHTLVIVCADHGDHLGEKRMIGHSFSLYNELVRVPLLIRDPSGNLPRGTVVDQCVSTRRLFHTILTAADAATDAEQSLSLMQHATSDPEAGAVFAEAVPPNNILGMLMRRQPNVAHELGCSHTRRAVFDAQYKLIQTGDDTLELYSLVDDLREQVNLQAILPERVEDLQERLELFVNDTHVVPSVTERAIGYDDPEVQRRLRDLGYLE